MSDDYWSAVDPADLAQLDQHLRGSRNDLREHVETAVKVLESDPDPAHAVTMIIPSLIGWSHLNLVGGYAMALVELAEAKRKGVWQ